MNDRTRISVQLQPGASVALASIRQADGCTVSTAVNAALREMAAARGLNQSMELAAQVERLAADVAALRETVERMTRP